MSALWKAASTVFWICRSVTAFDVVTPWLPGALIQHLRRPKLSISHTVPANQLYVMLQSSVPSYQVLALCLSYGVLECKRYFDRYSPLKSASGLKAVRIANILPAEYSS